MSKNSDILRTVIGILLGCLILFAAIKLKDRIVANKKQPDVKVQKQIKKVVTQRVQNTTIPVQIIEKGTLEALQRVDLYSEVQGILEGSSKLYKPGQTYSKGELILSVNNDEFLSGLKAQRSVLYNQIAQSIPDLQLDFPDVYPKWAEYLANFDIDSDLKPLPEFSNQREKFFINKNGIVTSYYNIRNLEERKRKYRIYAPFYSVVTEANVYPGALIMPGQKLGSLINTSLFEMAVSVDESYRDYVSVGKEVKLQNLDESQYWKGRIARIDPAINTLTQGITVYIELSSKDLKEGCFLEAVIEAEAIDSSFELSRKLLVENKDVFVVQGDSLALYPVDIAFFKNKTAVITNLPDSTVILKNPVPGAYNGMLVEVVNP